MHPPSLSALSCLGSFRSNTEQDGTACRYTLRSLSSSCCNMRKQYCLKTCYHFGYVELFIKVQREFLYYMYYRISFVLTVFLYVMYGCLLLRVFLCSTDILFLISISLPWKRHRATSRRMTFFRSVLRICYTTLVSEIMHKVRVLTVYAVECAIASQWPVQEGSEMTGRRGSGTLNPSISSAVAAKLYL